VAILDANRPRRAFRRLGRSQLENLLDQGASKDSEPDDEASDSGGDS